MGLFFVHIPAARSIDPPDLRLVVIKAVQKWCRGPGERQMPERLQEEYKNVDLEVSSMPFSPRQYLTYDHACVVTRGLLDYAEARGKYQEAVWKINVGRILLGAGRLSLFVADLGSVETER